MTITRFFLCSALVLMGCGDSVGTDAGSTPIDAGGDTDSGSMMTADAGGTDAGATDAGATDAGATDAGGTDAGDDAGTVSAEVTACQTTVDEHIATCRSSGQADRECVWVAWRGVCATGNPGALGATANCFIGDTSCRSFGDPGTTAHIGCTTDTRLMFETAASQASETAYCALCATTSLCSGDRATGAPFEFLSDGDNETLTTCINGGSTCDEADTCLGLAFPRLLACFE